MGTSYTSFQWVMALGGILLAVLLVGMFLTSIYGGSKLAEYEAKYGRLTVYTSDEFDSYTVYLRKSRSAMYRVDYTHRGLANHVFIRICPEFNGLSEVTKKLLVTMAIRREFDVMPTVDRVRSVLL